MDCEIARLFNLNSSDKLKLNELLQEYLFDENEHESSYIKYWWIWDIFYCNILDKVWPSERFLPFTNGEIVNASIALHSYKFTYKHKYAFVPARFFKLKFCFWNSEFVLTKIEKCRKCLCLVLFQLFQKLITFWGCDLRNSSLQSVLYDLVWLYGHKFVTVA